jgi:hypothetical protein
MNDMIDFSGLAPDSRLARLGRALHYLKETTAGLGTLGMGYLFFFSSFLLHQYLYPL